MDKELLGTIEKEDEKDKAKETDSPPKTPSSSSKSSSSDDMVFRSQTPNIQILMSSPRIKHP